MAECSTNESYVTAIRYVEGFSEVEVNIGVADVEDIETGKEFMSANPFVVILAQE